jgi:arylsulfatase A-like enzyme
MRSTIPFLLAATLLLPLAALHAAGKPNIIVILADDLGYGSLSCYGSKEINTPNIDHLATKGMRFTDFHSNGPMCTPTRAALMTGRYPQRCREVPDKELSPVFVKQRRENMKQRWAWGISLDELTLAEVLQKAGYKTALFGKWHLGYDARFHPMNQGFDEFRGYLAGAVDYHSHQSVSGLRELDWWDNKTIKNEKGYTTDLLTKYSEDFIVRHKDVPFFLYLAHAAPHTPLQGRDPFGKKSDQENYKEMIEVLDESVGTLCRVLREQQLEAKTLVIFCSDNGPQVNLLSPSGPFQGRKGSVYEGGHRVPFIASWPGVIAPGSTSEQTVMTMDFFPTFAKLAGAALPQNHPLDGIDLMPLLKGGEEEHDRTCHWLFGEAWAVRRGEWKLIGNGPKALRLVNLKTDPEEKQDCTKDQPERAKELARLHKEWLREVGDK